jgi:hypothetical protein
MRYFQIIILLLVSFFVFTSPGFSQDVAEDAQTVEKDVVDIINKAEPAAEKIILDENTKLVLAEADLYVDKASESFDAGDQPKAERALKKAASIMTIGLETAGEGVAKTVFESSQALTQLAQKVENGELKTVEEFEEALDKNYRNFFSSSQEPRLEAE